MDRHTLTLSLAGLIGIGFAVAIPVPAAAAPSSAGPAAATLAAATPTDRPFEAVRIDRRELSSSAGVARVHRRLESAAASVCRENDSQELARQIAYRHCVVEALTRAVRDIHDPGLSAYHLRKGHAGGSVAALRTARGAAVASVQVTH